MPGDLILNRLNDVTPLQIQQGDAASTNRQHLGHAPDQCRFATLYAISLLKCSLFSNPCII
jgi:hypothetical protein